MRFIQTLEKYLKVFVGVGNDVYNLTKYDQTQMIDVTEIRSLNTGLDLLPNGELKVYIKTMVLKLVIL